MSIDMIEVLKAKVVDADAQAAAAHRAWYSALPDFPADGRCECGNTGDDYGSWQCVEENYLRWTNGEIIDGVLHLTTDGWDDMSESGDREWIECNNFNGGCGRAYKLPDDMDWN